MRSLMFLPALLLVAASAQPHSLAMSDDDGPFEDIASTSAEPMNANCLACHSSAMVTYQPALSPGQWRDTVAKMKTVYKAPIDSADEPAIIAWLNAHSARQKPDQPPE